MTKEIIPFDDNNDNLPAYLRGDDSTDVNKALTAHDTSSFPNISIRGKQFRIVRGGEETLLLNPADGRSPASFINVVMIRISEYTAKSFYDGAFDANSATPQKPICFSNTGLIPDASVVKPCSVSCRVCQKNQYGSAVNMDGTPSKAKACRDSVRVAIASPDNLQDPMLLRVPPTSIKALSQLGRVLSARKAPYTGVIVEISFDPDNVAQKLVFRPVGYVTEAQHREIKQLAESELVKQIVGLTDDVISYAGEAQPITSQPAVAQAVATGEVTPEAVKEADIQTPIKQKDVTPPEIITSAEVKGLEGLQFDD